MNGIEAVARILKTEGVEWIACFPSNPLIEAAAKEGIRPVMFRHERGGIMAADGYSRQMQGKAFGVFCMQGGPGSESSMGAVAQAWSSNIPILLLPTGLPLDRVQVRPTFSAVRNYETITTSAEAILRPDQLANVMRRAFHRLRNGRPGPVLVEMTGDVCAQEVPPEGLDYSIPKYSRQAPSRGDVKDAVKALLGAKNPMIWAGKGVLHAGASALLTEFAELTNIPVYTTMPGKSAIDERHPLALGAGSGATTGPAKKWLNESDALFAIGSSLTLTYYGQAIPKGKVIIHSVLSVEDINKDHAADIGLPGDANLVLEMMIDEVKAELGEEGRGDVNNVRDAIAAEQKRWMDEWLPLLTEESAPMSPYRVIWDIHNTLDRENSIVTHDAGHPRDAIVPFYGATVPGSYVGWGKTTHLGYGIPLMIGSKMAKPDKFCLNFMGDGAFGMSGLDIETSVRANLPITTVVLNNGGMGGYDRSLPTALEVFGTSSLTGNYAKIAEGMGAIGIEVDTPAALVPALQRAQRENADGNTVLLDVKTHFEMRFSFK
ncbi:MAG: thiamine pyrophosphate-requiring protein [Chloroflexi bacterium]|nr:thiamine pyrophosphate-requiring protein [Chloroflexota bacterium]